MQFDIRTMAEHMGAVAWGVVIVLFIMSMYSIAVMIERYWTYRQATQQSRKYAPEVARSIWCSSDRVKAWDDYMLNRVAPRAPATCPNPVDKIVEYGEGKRISGTPTLFFEDGTRVPGAIPRERIEALLAKAKEKK